MTGDNFKRILAINPGSRYLAVAVFEETELLEWGIKSIRGKNSQEKTKNIDFIVGKLAEVYDIDILALKELHPSRSSQMLNKAVQRLQKSAKEKELKVHLYSLNEVEAFFSRDRINRKQLAEYVVAEYPFLEQNLQREKKNLNSYHLRMFEAVALGMVCQRKTEHIPKSQLQEQLKDKG